MRQKQCRRCHAWFTPTSQVTALTQNKCPPCWAKYQRVLYKNPRTPPPCKVCGKPTQDHRASVKLCPDHRFQVREKNCSNCGAAWMPKSWSEFQARTRCRTCFNKARKSYRHAAYHGLRKPRACVICGASTGDVRQSIHYCKEHGLIGKWWTTWKARALRTQAERVARLAELERMKPFLEEQTWLRTSKKELAAIKRLLRDRQRGQPPSPEPG